MQFCLYSTDYLGQDSVEDISLGYLHESVFLRKLEQLDCTRLFARVSFGDGEHVRYVALNMSIDRDTDVNALYLPHWLIPSDIDMGSNVEVEFLSNEAFPEATEICLRPLDSAFYNTNVRDHLTSSLTRLGILQSGTIVQMRLDDLGGYEMGFYIVRTAPANIVLCSGDEVAVEFEESSDLWDGRPPTPAPTAPEVLDTEQIIPGNILSAPAATMPGEGRVLGGAPPRRMPDGRYWNPYRCPQLPRREGSNA
jgi:hypothetical protein